MYLFMMSKQEITLLAMCSISKIFEECTIALPSIWQKESTKEIVPTAYQLVISPFIFANRILILFTSSRSNVLSTEHD